MGLSDKPADDDITIFGRAASNIDYNPFYHHLAPIISRHDPLKDYIASINYFILMQESRSERHLRRRLLRVYLKRRRPLRYEGTPRYFFPSLRSVEASVVGISITDLRLYFFRRMAAYFDRFDDATLETILRFSQLNKEYVEKNLIAARDAVEHRLSDRRVARLAILAGVLSPLSIAILERQGAFAKISAPLLEFTPAWLLDDHPKIYEAVASVPDLATLLLMALALLTCVFLAATSGRPSRLLRYSTVARLAMRTELFYSCVAYAIEWRKRRARSYHLNSRQIDNLRSDARSNH
ncbi:hypothetical protein LOC51_03830 [Rubrivivax sp. JA1024]|nr:hypothetical protein [Rubrivivax sp. JA1024]